MNVKHTIKTLLVGFILTGMGAALYLLHSHEKHDISTARNHQKLLETIYDYVFQATQNESENNYYFTYSQQSAEKPTYSVEKTTGHTVVPQNELDSFCKILNDTATARFLFENDTVIAFLKRDDRNPNTEALIIPKRHVAELRNTTKDEFIALLAGAFYLTQSLSSNTFTLRINNGSFQSIRHVHLHCIINNINIYDKIPLQKISEWRANNTDLRVLLDTF